MPQYDRWYKDVLKRKRKCFYPHRIRLLQNPGLPMFLFHVHHHAIMGEAQIVRSTTENGKNFYWFDKFLSYPHPVQLELLETDSRLARMAGQGQWRCVYIRQETVEEIRNLSKLPDVKRKKLGKDLQKTIGHLEKRGLLYELFRPSWQIYVRNESEKLKKDYKINEQILAKAQKYFSASAQLKLFAGRPFNERFYGLLYLTLRMLKIPTLVNDIAEISDVSPIRLEKLYRLFARELNLTVPPLDTEQLIKSRTSRLNISKKTIRRAVSLIKEAKKRRIIIGKAPSSIAAVATFVACQKEGEKVKQKQIAKTFGVSTVTIQNYSKNLEAL